MFDQMENLREAIRKRKASIEQIERILAGPNCNPASRYARRLIEDKQHCEIALAEFEREVSIRTATPTKNLGIAASGMLENGAFCDEVIKEILKVKNLYQSGHPVAEIQKSHPEWRIWKVLEGLGNEDRENFHRPNRWGPVVGFGLNLLGKYYGRSAATIRDWRKRVGPRRHQP